MAIEVNNLSAAAVDKNLLKRIIKAVLVGEKSKKDISFVLADPAQMKALNRKYRKKNKPTDVLTFPELDILICPKIIKDNAKKDGVSFERELVKVTIHGVLHFLGYDHEKGKKQAGEMLNKEKKYLKILFSL
ncbi:MAG: rRNA maturation RNase YbeY [Candidatus Pacebacteria bacterium]|nr:rRNA maturation RNase YbeY [Candidatus Paceibacterota bacterium]